MNIVFQGDSITDCGRGENGYGQGYAFMVSGLLGAEEAGKHEFYNKGISGNRVVDMYARIKRDCINLNPDVLSVLIGVNDVWHEIDNQNGVDAEKFEKIYDMLITEIKEALPDTKIIIMAPYVTKGSATEAAWDYFSGEVAKRAKAAERIAKKHNLKFVTTQDKFDEMLKKHPEPYWTQEGVHPTEAGHALLAGLWLSAFEEIK